MNDHEILNSLKTLVNESEYQKYLSKISFDYNNSTDTHLIFLADNIFIANWAKRNYINKINQILQNNQNIIKIDFKVKSKQHTETTTLQKKYITANSQSFINSEYRFDNFIIGECNKFAYKTAKEIASNQTKWNPLFIYGNTGLGKTHLLNAICHSVYSKKPNANIIFISAEAMFNEYRHRVVNRTMTQFRERFRKCDYLLIDDVQFLANTEKFQEEFFNTYNEIIKTGGKIVMTSDKTPKLIDKLEKRLKSRFDGGMFAKIESPELDTKISIIKQKCADNNIALDSEIINLLATQVHDNIREIEGIILNLHGHMTILNLPITLETIKHVLKDRESEQKQNGIIFDDIVKIVAQEFNIKPSEIKTKVRGKKIIAMARKIVAYIAREATNTTFPLIASELNLKDHSAVSKQIKSITELMEQDRALKNTVMSMISKLKQKE